MGPVVVLVPGAPAGLFVVCLLGGAGGERFAHNALSGTSLSRRRKNSLCSETDAANSGMRRNRHTRQMQHGRDGQLVSLHVHWLEHTPKAMNRCFLRDWVSQDVILLPYIWLSNLWAAVCHPLSNSDITHKTLKQPSTHKQLKLWPRNHRNPKFLLFQVHHDSLNFMVI